MGAKEIMNELNRCVSSVARGRLSGRMQRYVTSRLRPVVQRAVRQDPTLQRLGAGGINFSCYMDTDGGVRWQESAREVRMRVVVRGLRRVWENWSTVAEETLTVSGHIRRGRGRGGALEISATGRQVQPGRTIIASEGGRSGRREGGRAAARNPIDPEALRELSRSHERARPRRQSGSVGMEEEEEQLQM